MTNMARDAAGYLSCVVRVESAQLGRAAHTLIRLPKDVVDALQAEGTKRVEGELGEVPINLALRPFDGDICLWVGQSLLAQIPITPGEDLILRLRKVDPDTVETPRDLALALQTAHQTAAWEAMTPGKKRATLYRLNSAKRPETRAKRIAAFLNALPD